MTTTALMPVDPSVSPQQAARILTIRADLMPPEIRDGRRARRTRTMIVLLLVATLAVLGAWYWQATVAKNDAGDEYDTTFKALTDTLDAQKTKKLKTLVEYQEGGDDLETELTAVLADDLSWTNLINLLNDRAGDSKVKITEINGALAEPGSPEAAAGTVGTLNVTGKAANKRLVADYVNALGGLKHLENPFVTSVTKMDGGYSYSLTITITKQALCGRFAKDCPSGGK